MVFLHMMDGNYQQAACLGMQHLRAGVALATIV